MNTNIPDLADAMVPPVRESVTWTTPDRIVHTAPPTKSLLSDALYITVPSRKGNRYPRQRNYHGLLWLPQSDTHVWHESLFERRALLWLCFNHNIVSLASQPMEMRFADGTIHTPDFIALHADHRQVVYNVKPKKYLNAKTDNQFANAAALCAKVGWTHEVISEFDPVVAANIDWLANFRQPHFAPALADRDLAIRALNTPLPTDALVAALASAGWSGNLAAIYHLAWNGAIKFDLTLPLSSTSTARKASHVHA